MPSGTDRTCAQVCGLYRQPSGAAPHNIAFPVELIEVDPSESPSDLIAGRIALILNEL